MNKAFSRLQKGAKYVFVWAKTDMRDFVISPLHPVKRHRLLYGWRWGWVLYSVFIAIIVVGVIYGASKFIIKLDPADLLEQNNEGCQGHCSDKGNDQSLLWAIISQFADPGNIPMSKNRGATIAFICAASGIVCLSGLLLSSLVSFIASRGDDWRKGFIHYNRPLGKRFCFNDYVVIIGVNEQTAAIVKASLHRGIKYVLIQSNRDIERVRMKMNLLLDNADTKRVVFYQGERTSEEDIADLRLQDANEVYILGEDMQNMSEQDHDAYNITCLEHIAKYFQKHPRQKTAWWGLKKRTSERLKCHVNFEYQSTFMAFKFTHLYRSLNEKIEFVPFNVHEIWAKKILVDNYAIVLMGKHSEKKVLRYLPLEAYWEKDGETGAKTLKYIDEDSDRTVHLVVIGMNQMGVALAMQTALLVHLPNFHKDESRRTTITFIDDNAVKEGEYLRGRFDALFSLCAYRTMICGKDDLATTPWTDPMAGGRYAHFKSNFMDLQWEFIEGNVASPEIRDYMSSLAADTQHRTTTIAVCFNNPQQSMATALYLPETVLRRALQILVYQKNSLEMVNKVATGEREWKRYEKLRPFGMMENCYKGDLFENTLAKLAIKVYKDKTLNFSDVDNLIDHVNRLWSEEGIVVKLANINLVDSFPMKLRSIGLMEDSSLSEINKTLGNQEKVANLAKAEHSRWLTERLTMGYRPLEEEELAYFLSEDHGDDAKRAMKEYFKSKNRAHLDICSYELLAKVDNTLLNDQLIIKYLITQRFYKVEREILCRLAFRGNSDSAIKNSRTTITWDFIKDMVEIPEGKQKLNKIKMWMGAYPVTQFLWSQIMGGNPSKNPRGNDYPVENVSKYEVDDFILILNDITGLKFHLPEKDEWRYAAMGGVNTFDRSSIGNMAWNSTNSNGHTHEVKKKKSNKFKLYDMLGNVWEWTRTKHGPNYFFCGGSWRFSERECDLLDEKQTWCSSWTPEFKSADLGFRLILRHEFKKNESGVNQEWIPEKKKVLNEIVKNMRMIAEGSFYMGTNESVTLEGTNEEILNERPEHLLKMSGFYLSDAPVTQRQWVAFMGKKENPSGHKGYSLPVENVSYINVMKFIQVLNDYCRKAFGISSDCFDLPTEAQWEFAARGGGERGHETLPYSGGDSLDELAWHVGITKCTHPVRGKKSNDAGLYDMCGNVWEWCKDWYKADYYDEFSQDFCLQHKMSYPQQDPQGPTSGSTRVLRGGSWRFTVCECRVTRRRYWTEDYEADDVGFRLLLRPEGYELLSKALKIAHSQVG